MISVVKIGGNVVDNEELLDAFLSNFAAVSGPKILVHGGGVMASRMQKSMGVEPMMIQGRRVTDDFTLRVVTMVYAGWCNKGITASLQSKGCNAIGLSGCDADVIRASRRAPLMVDGKPVDYGHIGDVSRESVSAETLKGFLGMGLSPVLCAINHDGKGGLLNTNADTIAQSVATALAAAGEEVRLVYCFEKSGVLMDKDDESTLIQRLDKAGFEALKQEGKVEGGMLPKLENAFKAISEGVSGVMICHASNINNGIGTLLTA